MLRFWDGTTTCCLIFGKEEAFKVNSGIPELVVWVGVLRI